MATRNDDFPEDTLLGRTHLLYLGDQGKNLGEVRLFFDAKGGLASTQRAAIGLSREWPEDAALKKLQEDTKLAVNEINKNLAQQAAPLPPAPPPAASPAPIPVPPHPTYTASARCQPCHSEAFGVWLKSGHARAFAALQKAHQDFNPQCVGCHTIGYGRPNGFQSATTTPMLINVGCESCHGPSGGHPGAAGKEYGHVDTSFCVTCHTKENSPDFDPATYIPKVRHWKDAAGR
jgi:cytochrome c554/c'-like protein